MAAEAQDSPVETSLGALSEHVRYQKIWNDRLGLAPKPVKYEHSYALLLSWADEADDLGVAGEVKILGGVLKDKYGFEVTGTTLSTIENSTPQQQALAHMSKFVMDHDGGRSLLLVYYAGHGFSKVDSQGHIMLSGKRTGTKEQQLRNSIEWNKVETSLEATSADVLVIFDCCSAGLLCKRKYRGPSPRCFQYLGACLENAQTPVAGPKSFTTAMTWALEHLADRKDSRPFPITELNHVIQTGAPGFRRDQQSVFYGERFEASGEVIYLAPLHSEDDAGVPSPQFRDDLERTVEDTIDIRIHLGRMLDDHLCERICNGLVEARHEDRIPFRHMVLLGKNRQEHIAKLVAGRWQSAVRQVRQQKFLDAENLSLAIPPTPQILTPGDLTPLTTTLISTPAVRSQEKDPDNELTTEETSLWGANSQPPTLGVLQAFFLSLVLSVVSTATIGHLTPCSR